MVIMAGNSNDIKERLAKIPGGWEHFLQVREIKKATGKGSPQSRNREAEAATMAWAKENNLIPSDADAAHRAASAAVGSPVFMQHAKAAADLAQADSAPSLDVRWVAANILNMDAKPSDAPSKAAWGLLVWARSEPSEFYRGPYTRLLPTKSQVDDEADQNTDDQLDSDVDFFLEARRLSALRKSSEGSDREREVPAGLPGRGPVEQSLPA